MKRRTLLSSFISLLFLLTSCSKDPLAQARKMERLGRYPSAISLYEKQRSSAPQGKNSAEALFRIAEIYRTVFKNYPEARRRYDELSRSDPSSAWASAARDAMMNCPDYFPLEAGLTRLSGDSQSGGQFMRTEERFESLAQPAGRFRMRRQIYAGDAQVSALDRLYEKRDRELREFSSSSSAHAVVLKYPPEKGLRWESVRDGKKTIFVIEDDRAEAKTRAGVFSDCLKLRIEAEGFKESWKVEYYAPGAGLVASAAGSPAGETRIAELLSIARAPAPQQRPPGRMRALLGKLKKAPKPAAP